MLQVDTNIFSKTMMYTNSQEIKRLSLEKSIHEAAQNRARLFFDFHYKGYKSLVDIVPECVNTAYRDCINETLYGDGQALEIKPDEKLFSKSEYIEPNGESKMWNLLDKYFEDYEVENIFYNEWYDLLSIEYGVDWRELMKKVA